jgi:hypothetical protein
LKPGENEIKKISRAILGFLPTRYRSCEKKKVATDYADNADQNNKKLRNLRILLVFFDLCHPRLSAAAISFTASTAMWC